MTKLIYLTATNEQQPNQLTIKIVTELYFLQFDAPWYPGR